MKSKNEKYLLKQTIHMGLLKQTFSKGCKFTVDREKNVVDIDGRLFTDLRDVDICIRNGFLIPFSEDNQKALDKTVDISANKPLPRDENKPAPKMKVVQSDTDLMEREIDISYTKKKAVEVQKKNDLSVLREDSNENIRGIEVIRKVAAVEDYQEIGDPSGQLGVGKVVAKIGEPKKPVSQPKADVKEVNEKLKSRKSQIEANRKKAKEEAK